MSNSPRARMTMRAWVSTITNAGELDAHNSPARPLFQRRDAIPTPCYAWMKAERSPVNEDRLAVIADLRALFPKSDAITTDDQIETIENRLGVTLFAGPFRIDGVLEKPHHKELMLERVA